MHYKNQTYQNETQNSYQCCDVQQNLQQQEIQLQRNLIKVFRPLDLKRPLQKLHQKIQMMMLTSFLAMRRAKSASQSDLQQKKLNFAQIFYLNQVINKLQNNYATRKNIFILFSLNKISQRSLQLEKARIVSVLFLSNWSKKKRRIYERLRLRFKYGRQNQNDQVEQIKEALKKRNTRMMLQNGFRIIHNMFQLRKISITHIFIGRLIKNKHSNHPSCQSASLFLQKVKIICVSRLRISFNKIKQFLIDKSSDNPQIYTNILKHASFLCQRHSNKKAKAQQLKNQRIRLFKLRCILRKSKVSNKQLKVCAFRAWRCANARHKIYIAQQIIQLKQIKDRLEDKLN